MQVGLVKLLALTVLPSSSNWYRPVSLVRSQPCHSTPASPV
jgi:hypothetical protein